MTNNKENKDKLEYENKVFKFSEDRKSIDDDIKHYIAQIEQCASILKTMKHNHLQVVEKLHTICPFHNVRDEIKYNGPNKNSYCSRDGFICNICGKYV